MLIVNVLTILILTRYTFDTFGMLIDDKYIVDTLMSYFEYLLIHCYVIH